MCSARQKLGCFRKLLFMYCKCLYDVDVYLLFVFYFDLDLGHKGQFAPRCHALDTMITKLYHGIQKAVDLFRFKNFEHLLGSGGGGRGAQLRPGCRRHMVRTFHTPGRCRQT